MFVLQHEKKNILLHMKSHLIEIKRELEILIWYENENVVKNHAN